MELVYPSVCPIWAGFQSQKHKKFKLMLTRCAKAYSSSSCSQTVSLFLAISSQFILGVCVAAEDRKNQ